MEAVQSRIRAGFTSHRFAALVVASVVTIVTAPVVIGLATCTTAYGAAGKLAAAAVAVVGVALATVLFVRVTKFCTTSRRAAIVSGVAAAIVFLPLASMVWPGRITTARFGLTVYGAIPVPFFDLRINDSGVLGFRDKAHSVSLEEARSVIGPHTQVLVIGTGWDNLVRVDPAVRKIDGIRVIVLPTPDAFREYNRLKSAGRRVALLAHSTC